MKLSAPIYQLKRQARLLSRQRGIPLHQALNEVAQQQGLRSWSLLAARFAAQQPANPVLARLHGGELMLLGGRAGQGKTLMGVEMAIAAMQAGQQSFFFSLEYTQADMQAQFATLGADMADFRKLFTFDASDNICASYIIDKLQAAPRDTLVVVDYLQILDQMRQHPPVSEQVQAIKIFAEQRHLKVVFLSQIDRRYNPVSKPTPELSDIRLPNPLDLTLFNNACFLNAGELRFTAIR